MKRTYGLMIGTDTRHGSAYVTAKVLVREDDSPSPINPRDIESDIWGAPKHMDGLSLDGLGLWGFWSDIGSQDFISFNYALYRDVVQMEERQIKAMAKTITKVNMRIEKDAAREPGDVLFAFCAALKLDWVVERTSGDRCTYSDNEWHWMTPAEGRNRIRSIIQEAKPEEAAA